MRVSLFSLHSLLSYEICHTCSLPIFSLCCFLPRLIFIPIHCLMQRLTNYRTHIFFLLVYDGSQKRLLEGDLREDYDQIKVNIQSHQQHPMNSRSISHLKELQLRVCDTHKLTWNLSSLPFLIITSILAWLASDKSRTEHQMCKNRTSVTIFTWISTHVRNNKV